MHVATAVTDATERKIADILTRTYGLAPPRQLVALYALAADNALAVRAAQPRENGGPEPTTVLAEFIDAGTMLDVWLDDIVLDDPRFRSESDAPDDSPPPRELLTHYPEFFAFASPQVDGITYGFVVHAPELAAEDWPLAEWNPRGGQRPIHGLGDTCGEGLATLLGRARARCAEPDAIAWPQGERLERLARVVRIESIARTLGVALPDPPDVPTHVFEEGTPPRPRVPPGWRYVRTSDGIGVLAPADAFGDEDAALPEPADTLDDYDACDDEDERDDAAADDPVETAGGDEAARLVALAERALAASHPASALRLLREGLWRYRYENPEPLVAPIERAYRALGRPLLAQRVRGCTL